jgi:hypothetical protein
MRKKMWKKEKEINKNRMIIRAKRRKKRRKNDADDENKRS